MAALISVSAVPAMAATQNTAPAAAKHETKAAVHKTSLKMNKKHKTLKKAAHKASKKDKLHKEAAAKTEKKKS